MKSLDASQIGRWISGAVGAVALCGLGYVAVSCNIAMMHSCDDVPPVGSVIMHKLGTQYVITERESDLTCLIWARNAAGEKQLFRGMAEFER